MLQIGAGKDTANSGFPISGFYCRRLNAISLQGDSGPEICETISRAWQHDPADLLPTTTLRYLYTLAFMRIVARQEIICS